EQGFIGAIELFVPENRTFDSEWTSDDLKTIAFTDALCEIPNRRYGEIQLKKFRQEQEEGEAPYALAIVDIDHFKQVNDTHGHDIGDEILKMTAKTLAGSIRSTDTAVRWGGEEFL